VSVEAAVVSFQLDHGLAVTGFDRSGDIPVPTLEAIADEWARLQK
jgi:hypothetical protein